MVSRKPRFRNLRRVAAGLAPSIMVLAALALAPRVAGAENIKIGIVKTAGMGWIFIAKERGYFAAEGLTAELVPFDGAQLIPTATISGDLDIGASGISAALYSLAGQGALRIIGGGAREFPGFQAVGFLASNRAYAAGLKSFKDLPGHAVAVAVIGGNFHYNVALLGEKYGFALSSVRLLPLQSLSNIASALTGGTADAGMQTATGTISLVQRGDAKLLGWIGDEVPWQLAAQWTAAKTADQRRDTVERFLRAARKGMREYHDAFTGPNETRHDGPTASEVLAIIAKYLGQPIEDIRTGAAYQDPEGRLDVKDILHQIAWYKAQGMVKGEVDGDAIIDKRYVIPLPEH